MKYCHLGLVIFGVCFVVYTNACKEQKNDISIRPEEVAVTGAVDNSEVDTTTQVGSTNISINTGTIKKKQLVQSLKEKLLARLKGKSALLVFSMRTCCCGDMAEEIAWELVSQYSEVLQVLYINAFSDRELALECGIETLPTVLLYDAAGKEQERIAGDFGMVEIEEILSKNRITKKGVK